MIPHTVIPTNNEEAEYLGDYLANRLAAQSGGKGKIERQHFKNQAKRGL